MPIAQLTRATLLNNVLVNGTGSVESSALPLQHTVFIEAFVLQATSPTGAADVKLEYATSPDGTNFEAYADTTDITSSQATDKPNNTEGFNPFLPPTPAPLNEYIKVKVTGVGANPTDTQVTCYAFLREGMS